MLINVLDSSGVVQKVIMRGQEAPLDKSGVIAATAVAQVALAANALRSGYNIQNRGASVMYVNDLGTAAAAVGANAGSFAIQPGAFFPSDGYPVTTGAISILGTIGDGFAVREW